MARPTKQGIDYFPVDVAFDSKIELLIAEFGNDAIGTLVTIWQMIYQNEGYYIENGDDLYLLVRRKNLADVDNTKNIIEKCIERGIFDKDLHRKHGILTSSGIQKRFLAATRLKKSIKLIKEYMLVGVSNIGNYTWGGVSNVGNATNEDVEVEEDVKEKKIIEKKKNPIAQKPRSTKKVKRFIPPTIEEVTAYTNERISTIDPHYFVDYNQARGWMIGKAKMKDWKAAIRNWERNEQKRPIATRMTRSERNKQAAIDFVKEGAQEMWANQ